MKYVLGIDWITFWCERETPKNVQNYKFGEVKTASQIFRNVVNVYCFDEVVAVFCYEPCSKILSQQSAQIKIANKILYSTNRENYINDILRFCGCKVLSFSRIDIYADLQYFSNGLYAEDLVKGFMNGRYLKNRGGKFSAFGVCNSTLNFNGLTFGKRGSDVYCRLYNKTKEMTEEKTKPYIEETWGKVQFSPLKNVWRLEFEIKGGGLQMCSIKTGEFNKLLTSILTDNEYLKNVFALLVKDFFEFKIKDETKNKSRMKNLDLFGSLNCEFVRVFTHEYKNGGLREKMLIKSLHQYKERYGVFDIMQNLQISEMKNNLIKQCGLQDYFLRHYEYWDNELRR